MALGGYQLPGEKRDILQVQITLNMCHCLLVTPSSFYH